MVCVYTDAAPFFLSFLVIHLSLLFLFHFFPFSFSFTFIHSLSFIFIVASTFPPFTSNFFTLVGITLAPTQTHTRTHIQPTNTTMSNTTTRKDPISTPLLQSNDNKRHSQPRGLMRQSHILQSRRASSTGTSTGTPTQHYCYACDQPCTHSDRKHINALGRLYHYQCFVCEASIYFRLL